MWVSRVDHWAQERKRVVRLALPSGFSTSRTGCNVVKRHESNVRESREASGRIEKLELSVSLWWDVRWLK